MPRKRNHSEEIDDLRNRVVHMERTLRTYTHIEKGNSERIALLEESYEQRKLKVGEPVYENSKPKLFLYTRDQSDTLFILYGTVGQKPTSKNTIGQISKYGKCYILSNNDHRMVYQKWVDGGCEVSTDDFTNMAYWRGKFYTLSKDGVKDAILFSFKNEPDVFTPIFNFTDASPLRCHDANIDRYPISLTPVMY